MKKNTNLIIGATETGKTRGICFSEVNKIIEEGKNLFVLDNKEEYYPRFKEQLENNGYKVWLINLRNPLRSNSFNILKYPYILYKNNEKDIAITLVTNIAKNICVTNSNDFWENSAADYLTSLILILFENYDLEEINFINLGILIHMLDDKKDAEQIKKYFEKLDVTSIIYRLGSTTVYAPIETKGGIISVLKYKINIFFNREEILKVLSNDELDLTNLGNKVAFFFEGTKDLNGIANIMLEQLIIINRKMQKELILMLDNFNTLPRFAGIDEITEYASLNKVKTYFVTNCVEELTDLYGKYFAIKMSNVIDIAKIENIDIDEKQTEVNYPIRIDKPIKTISTKKLFKD